jgi:Family of unknown function (DUF6428)
MLSLDKPLATPTVTSWPAEVSARMLLDALPDHRDKMLVFIYDGRTIQSGYHVTEIKSGRFDALDCGANPESWTETFIQLWDIPAEADRTFMPVWKFLAIMKKVADEVPFDAESKLTFEVSDPNSAMRLFGISGLEIDAEAVRVSLERRPASCKPRDRWLERKGAEEVPCCTTATSSDARCCS